MWFSTPIQDRQVTFSWIRLNLSIFYKFLLSFIKICFFGCGAWSISRFSRFYKFVKGFVIYFIKFNVYFLWYCSIVHFSGCQSIIFKLRYSWMLSSLFLNHFFVLGNVCQMLGPKKVSGYHQETAGILQTISLVFGLGVGSLVGPALVQLL